MDNSKDFFRMIKEQIRIVDYARELGFTIVRRGKYFSLKEHDSVMIDDDKNCFWRNSRPGSGTSIGKGGSIIDFLMEFEDLSRNESIRVLRDRVDFQKPIQRNITDRTIPKKNGLVLPPKDKNMRKVFAYLTKTRKIKAEIIQDLVKRKQLYQDNHGNCVFVSYDEKGQAVFACRRGTNTYKPFYGDCIGCDYTRGFYINNNADELYVTESVIDALSVMSIFPECYRNYLVLASAGKTDATDYYLQSGKVKVLSIGTDNDRAGIVAAKILAKKAMEAGCKYYYDFPPEAEGKDWNAVLQRRMNA